MKIAFFTMCLVEFGGGFEKYLLESSSFINNNTDDNVDIISIDEKMGKRIGIFISLYYLKNIFKNVAHKESTSCIKNKIGKGKYYRCKSFKELRKVLSNYDVVYSKNEILDAFFIKMFLGYKNIPPVIFGCHTPVYYPNVKTLHSFLHNLLYKSFVYRFFANGAKIFQVINSFEEKYYKKLFPKKEIVKISNPINYSEYRRMAEKYIFKFYWQKDKINILWVGRLTEQKGVDELIKIIDKLNSAKYEKKIVWNIAGEGIEKNKIMTIKKKWENVNYLGHIESRYMPSVYKQNTLFISTSRWETFGFTLVEAQSLGLPVISFDIPGPNEIIIDSKNGYLVKTVDEFCNRISFFINTHGNKDETEKYIFENIKRFSHKKIFSQLVKLFRRVYRIKN